MYQEIFKVMNPPYCYSWKYNMFQFFHAIEKTSCGIALEQYIVRNSDMKKAPQFVRGD